MSSRRWTLVETLVTAAVIFAAVFAGASTAVVVLLAVACIVVGGAIQFSLMRRSLRRNPSNPPE